MLAGHADEIALSVNYIDNDGYIWVKRMGGVDAIVSKAQRVTVHTHKIKKKAELEAFSKYGLNNITEKYLPKKLEESKSF